MDEHLLEVKNLKVSFKVGKKKLTAVDNVTFSLDRGKVIGIVGESGCGKSVTATSIMRLVSPSVCEIDENSQILFEGEDLSKASEARMRKVRGNEISMIFQEPMSSLNPVYRIGDQMLEMIRTHHREAMILRKHAATASVIGTYRIPLSVFGSSITYCICAVRCS